MVIHARGIGKIQDLDKYNFLEYMNTILAEGFLPRIYTELDSFLIEYLFLIAKQNIFILN